MNKEDILKVLNSQKTTVLSFPDRGPWGSSSYRGNCSGYIPGFFANLFHAKNVSEIFAGSGTTSDICRDLGLNYIGIDLNPNPVRDNIVAMDILDDNIDLPDEFYNSDMLFLHPPYPGINKVRYSNNMWKDTTKNNLAGKDIQNMPFEEGMKAVNKAILRGYASLPKGAFEVILVGEIRSSGKYYSMYRELALPGEFYQTYVKMQHNTVSGRNTYNSSMRSLTGQEMIAVVRKPSGYEFAYVIPRVVKSDVRDLNMTTWKDVVMAVMRELGQADLKSIYKAVEGRKKSNNPNWMAKIRQTLQYLRDAGMVKNVSPGNWALAS